MNCALREALRLVQEESLGPRFARRWLNQRALVADLGGIGLQLLVADQHRIPVGVEEGRVRSRLLQEFNIEIADGLGDLKGQIWRMGLMGHSSRRENVLLLLGALESILRSEGVCL